MTRFEDPAYLVRAMKGPAASVYLALIALGGGPVGEKRLIVVSGYSQNSVREGLSVLTMLGQVWRDGRTEGWRLTAGALQLPLMQDLLGDGESQTLTLEEPTTATTYIVDSNDVVKQQQQRESNFDSRDENRESKFDSRALVALLNSVGIMGGTAEKLAKMEHISAEYITAHAEQARIENISTGLLVTRLRDGDPVPAKRAGGARPAQVAQHAKGCDCDTCRRKYISGEFSQFVNH